MTSSKKTSFAKALVSNSLTTADIKPNAEFARAWSQDTTSRHEKLEELGSRLGELLATRALAEEKTHYSRVSKLFGRRPRHEYVLDAYVSIGHDVVETAKVFGEAIVPPASHAEEESLLLQALNSAKQHIDMDKGVV